MIGVEGGRIYYFNIILLARSLSLFFDFTIIIAAASEFITT